MKHFLAQSSNYYLIYRFTSKSIIAYNKPIKRREISILKTKTRVIFLSKYA